LPRFYLHLCNGNGFTEDTDGAEFDNLAAAKVAAVAGLRDIMAAELKEGSMNMASFVEIEGEDHQLLTTVQFVDAVDIRTDRIKRARP
jgi:hypothetical protein